MTLKLTPKGLCDLFSIFFSFIKHFRQELFPTVINLQLIKTTIICKNMAPFFFLCDKWQPFIFSQIKKVLIISEIVKSFKYGKRVLVQIFLSRIFMHRFKLLFLIELNHFIYLSIKVLSPEMSFC